ncbi:MAG TPA: hypothetical protein VFA35_04790 [Burkholderiaceae bacterium]|nr:hypothetical protein [Burkholderiaceae bacterium]
MRIGSAWPAGAALALLATCASPLLAQTMYRCGNGTGASYLSDKPCSSTGGGVASGNTRLGAYGPVQAPTRGAPTYYPSMAKAPEHLAYMGTECAQLSEGIRTGPARGLAGSTMSELRENYARRCSEDEQQARQRVGQDRSDERAQRKATDQAQRDARNRAVLNREQCYEMLRILHGKRQRAAGMNAGEKADLELFEANYKNRCVAG